MLVTLLPAPQIQNAIYTSEFKNMVIVLITFKELTTQSNTALSLGT